MVKPFPSPDDFVSGANGGSRERQEQPTQESQSLAAGGLPWQALPDDPALTKGYLFQLPIRLHAKLKFLGETTYGESMRSIMLEAVEREVERRIKEKGL